MTPIVPFTSFAPDADPSAQGILTDCSNLIPTEYGYAGAPSAVAVSAAPLAAECLGATVATKLDGTRRVFAGTATKLYELSGSSWTDRTPVAPFTGSADTRWSFCQFGDTTIAANYNDTIVSSTSGGFNAISGAPKARIVVSASNNFIIAFNTNDTTYGVSPDRWWCCAQNDQTSWTPNVSTRATTGRLIAIEGPIQTALPMGSYVVAYKQRAMFLGGHVEGPDVWDFTLIPSGEMGAIGPEAVCDIGGPHFGVGNDGFWIFDGSRPVPVGQGVVRQWFLDNSSPTYRYRTKVSYDRQRNVVRIYFPSRNASACDSCLVYHVSKQRWGVANVTMQAPLNFIAPGLTVNALDSLASTIDTLPNTPLDSQYWASGGQAAAFFNASNQLVSQTGVCVSSSFTTGDMGDDDEVTLIDKVRVRWNLRPSTATATGFYKFAEGESLTQGASGSLNDGKFDLRQSGRFHRFKVDMTGDHKLTGIAVKTITVGTR